MKMMINDTPTRTLTDDEARAVVRDGNDSRKNGPFPSWEDDKVLTQTALATLLFLNQKS
jgi:hypothetical protein